MSDHLKHFVTEAATKPDVVKAVGLAGFASNLALWFADNANLLVALSTLVITWVMFYYTRKKTKREIAVAEAQEALLRAQLRKFEDRN